MRKDFHQFVSNLSGEFPIAAFTDGSLAIFNEGLLHILKKFTLLKNQTEYEQYTKITPVPQIPSGVEITNIKASNDGSRVILISNDTIFVILIEQDIITMLSKKSKIIEVFSECKKIGTKLTKHATTKIIEAKFIPERKHPGCVLSVLTSDNCLRLYNLISDQIELLCEIDFNRIAAANDTGKDNTFGLYKSIASFDIVSCFENLCFLVIDTEGQMYSASFLDNFIPIISFVRTPQELTIDPLLICCVNQPYSQVFSQFVMLSNDADGNLTHFIVMPKNGDTEIIIQEKVTIPHLPSTAYIESVNASSYFIGTTNRLYMIDLSFITDYYGSLFTQKKFNSVCESKMHVVAASLEANIKSSHSTQGQIANLPCGTEDGELLLLLVRFSTPSIVTSFIKNQISMESHSIEPIRRKEKAVDWKQTTVDPILSKINVLPTITGKSEENQKAFIKQYGNLLQMLISNLDMRKAASDLALKRLSDIPIEAVKLTTDRIKIIERLAALSNDLSTFHNELNKRRQIMERLSNRLDSLNERANEQRPITSQEKRTMKTLQEYKKQAMQISDAASLISVNLAEEKRATLGPVRSFQPSLASYEASGAKITREVEFIRKRFDKLSDLVNKAQL